MASVFARLSQFYRPYRRLLYLSLTLLVIATALGLVYPYLLKMIVNQVIMGGQYGKLPLLLAGIIGAAIAKGLFNFGFQYSGQLFGSKSAYDLRNALYRKLNMQPFAYYDQVHTGDLMSRMTADLDAFRMFLAFGINNLVNLFLIIVFGIGLMVSMNGWLALVIACLMPVLAVTAVRFDGRLRPTYRHIRKTLGTLNSGVQETIMGMRTVKSFAKEDREISKFNGRNDAYFDANMDATQLWKKFFPFIEFIGNLGVVLILFIGGWLVMRHHSMNLGDLVAFLSVVWTLIWPLSNLGFFLNNLTQAVAAGDRLLEVLEAKDELADQGANAGEADRAGQGATAGEADRAGQGATAGEADRADQGATAGEADRADQGARAGQGGHLNRSMRGGVEFSHVSMRYGAELVLDDVSLCAEAGDTIALVGLTGAGKSTIVNLLPRFYDVAVGSVKIDGVDVREWDLQALRNQIAVVFQEPFLFSTTIFSNIAYGNPQATIEDVRRAAEMADAAEFIERLPEGYYTLVGERGLGLSGGQKQRLALARAILMNPSILVLDDATSAVDMETEYKIQQDLERIMKGRTTFIIAHRISSVKRANQILVIEHGRIVQRGTHEELLTDSDGLYKRIFDMQFQDFESVVQTGASHSGTSNARRTGRVNATGGEVVDQGRGEIAVSGGGDGK